MAHIASCIRVDAGRSHVYITQQNSSSKQVTFKEAGGSTGPAEKSAAVVSPPLRSSSFRYQLWPSPPALKTPGPSATPTTSSERLNALSAGRSPTSLSDTAVPEDSAPLWQRSSSLTRRRKVSVPELGGTMATVQEIAIDSPTIPGRPPLRRIASEAVFHHERSSSLPATTWRTGPFGDAMTACVTGPSSMVPEQHALPGTTAVPKAPKLEPAAPLGRQLSPILSPGVNVKPKLKVDTTECDKMDIDETPPEVPPKSPFAERKCSPAPPPLKLKSSRTQLVTPCSAQSGGTTPLSALDSRRSPLGNASLPTPVSALSNAFAFGSPLTALDNRCSPRIEKRDPMALYRIEKKEPQTGHGRNMSESSVMERGRPVRRSSKRQKTRACSETNNLEQTAVDNWKVPRGMRLPEASATMSEADKSLLHKQARDQADKFEVLTKRDVGSMSRELRALDERCEYLRRTYKSLRAGRQKLHGRMISYLRRGETVIFSRESLLKQEEALAELDISIDEFILKLEQAENRRLRLRQKLLEHVAAAVLLDTPTTTLTEAETQTPPRSPVKAESPGRSERRNVESIKIYADGHVLSLFSDIEQAIGKMCEQSC